MLPYHAVALGLLNLLPLARGLNYAIYGTTSGVMSSKGARARHFPVTHESYVNHSSHDDFSNSLSSFDVDHSSSHSSY